LQRSVISIRIVQLCVFQGAEPELLETSVAGKPQLLPQQDEPWTGFETGS
jgi:hypothetical protein